MRSDELNQQGVLLVCSFFVLFLLKKFNLFTSGGDENDAKKDINLI